MDEENNKEEVIKAVEPENVASSNVNAGEGKGFGITSLILGIVSLVLFCIPYLGVLCAILAIIFGICGLKKAGRGMAIAGIILGIIALVILIAIIIIGIVAVASVPGILNETMNSTYYYTY